MYPSPQTRWFAAAAALVLSAACSGTDSISSPAFQVAPSASMVPGTAAASGAIVIRTEVTTFLVHLDAANELLSVHAPSTVCGAGELNVADAQFVVTPSAIGQFIAQIKDPDEQVAVYEASSFADAGLGGSFDFAGLGDIVDFTAFCPFLTGPARVAEGTVRRLSNFSNASFVASWIGTIQGTDGQSYRLREAYQLGADAQDPNNPDEWTLHVSRIRLGRGG